MKYNELINELLDLLDNNYDIKRIKSLKKNLINDASFIKMLNNYHVEKTVANKKKLYENKYYLEYLQCENNINKLIYSIKSQFKEFNNRKCQHESH